MVEGGGGFTRAAWIARRLLRVPVGNLKKKKVERHDLLSAVQGEKSPLKSFTASNRGVHVQMCPGGTDSFPAASWSRYRKRREKGGGGEGGERKETTKRKKGEVLNIATLPFAQE